MSIPAVSESRVLRGKIELVLPMLLSAGRRLFRHPRVGQLYPEYLFMSHCVIRASVPLMQRARERAAALPGDRVASIVSDYFETHIDEEFGHDEWLLEDMAALGVDTGEALSRPPSATVAGLVGAQYYWTEHYHPVALLGYVALLEGYPPVAAEIEDVRRRTGYGPDAFRTLFLHGELDPHHGQELDEVLDSLPLTERQRSLLGMSAISSVQGMTAAVEEVLAKASAA
ncbi:MAG TPA: iron-containing redox enzyme family protein [Candidatus Limnocylindria bacterium]|nr:iron-containing redox enzyme family protein [Candidatus Limnocylindria bacterium]